MHKIKLTVFFILIGIARCFAQDIIILKTGDELEAKVTKVGTSEIEYKKWTNPDGPVYTVLKSDVFMIKYQNGQKDVFFKQTSSVEDSTPASQRKNSIFGEIGGLGYMVSWNYERLFLTGENHFMAWRMGVSPMGALGTFSTGLSFNAGSKTDFFELGLGGGYLYKLNDDNHDMNNYFYFSPNIGYRRMSKSGFLFKSYLSLITIKDTYYEYDGYSTYYSNLKKRIEYSYFPFIGFSFGYSF